MLSINKKGSAMVMVMIYTLILMILGTSVLAAAMTEYRMEKSYRESVTAYYLAEAGLEKAICSIREMETISIDGLSSKTWNMNDNDRDLLKSGVHGDYTVLVKSAQVDDTIYEDEQQTVVEETIYSITLKSGASVEGMAREIEVQIKVEDFVDSGIKNKVEIIYWRQKR